MQSRCLTLLLSGTLGVLLSACSSGNPSNVPPGPNPTPACTSNLSGNFSMYAAGSSTQTFTLGGVLNQTGNVATANNLTATGQNFNCKPLAITLLNGQIQNTSNFVGSFLLTNTDTHTNFGSFSFNVGVSSDRHGFSGSYSGMPTC